MVPAERKKIKKKTVETASLACKVDGRKEKCYDGLVEGFFSNTMLPHRESEAAGRGKKGGIRQKNAEGCLKTNKMSCWQMVKVYPIFLCRPLLFVPR